jgi:hypothetical protein
MIRIGFWWRGDARLIRREDYCGEIERMSSAEDKGKGALVPGGHHFVGYWTASP